MPSCILRLPITIGDHGQCGPTFVLALVLVLGFFGVCETPGRVISNQSVSNQSGFSIKTLITDPLNTDYYSDIRHLHSVPDLERPEFRVNAFPSKV